MMRAVTCFTLSLILFGTAVTATVHSQEQVKPEKLTVTEVLAVNAVEEELNKSSQDAGNVIADIQKAHPGYTFDFRTGQLVKLVPMKTPEAQVKTENRTKTAPTNPVPKANP